MAIQTISNTFMLSAPGSENLCLVCGYGMDDPPKDYNICASCGTEFGVNDVNSTIPDLREVWIADGPRWWSPTDDPPLHWDPWAQLANLLHSEDQAIIDRNPFALGDPRINVYPSSLESPNDIMLSIEGSRDDVPTPSSLRKVERLSLDAVSLTAA